MKHNFGVSNQCWVDWTDARRWNACRKAHAKLLAIIWEGSFEYSGLVVSVESKLPPLLPLPAPRPDWGAPHWLKGWQIEWSQKSFSIVSALLKFAPFVCLFTFQQRIAANRWLLTDYLTLAGEVDAWSSCLDVRRLFTDCCEICPANRVVKGSQGGSVSPMSRDTPLNLGGRFFSDILPRKV